MKKTHTLTRIIISTILFSICAITFSKAQMFYIPDSAFRAKLTSLGYSSCMVGDSIDSNCPMVSGAGSLNISNASISNLQGIEAFTNLQDIDCSYNLLTSIAALPNSLYSLQCEINQLTSLPALPGSLTELYCDSNQLTSLPVLPNSLGHLDCDNNQLASLPILPDSLNALECSYNQLTSLPPLPNKLVLLYCRQNLLTSLPALPNLLLSLDCTVNQLTSLPALPNSLNVLACSANILTSLPTLPNLVTQLLCGFNQLTSLPVLPASMVKLLCGDNQLTNLPELPDSLIIFDCRNNPNLHCLPQLKRIVNFYFSGTGVSCLPNYGNVTSSNPLLSSIPLCGLFNLNGCGIFWNITGKSYFDSNSNCLFDSADVRQKNMKIELYQNGNLLQQTFTIGGGFYSFNTNLGTYETRLDTSNIPFDVLCPATYNYTDTVSITDSLKYSRDFALKCKTGFDLGALSLASFTQFMPAHYTTINIAAGDVANFYGVHCAAGISGTVTVVISGSASYNNSAPGALAPTSVNGDTITWNVADFGAINVFNAFNIIVQTDTSAIAGSQVCFDVSVIPFSTGDNNVANNTLTHCSTIVSSFDPNDKEVYPNGFIDIDSSSVQWLTYTIRFQNTGTTAAEHIYIDDTLSSNLDVSTFQLLAYSHQPIVQVLDGNIARFNFPNINLADSNSNEPASHGYVQYKIKLKDSLAAGTQITNTAYIYFDFNSPVATNTTLNTITSVLAGILSEKNNIVFSVYPNPAKDLLTIHVNENIFQCELTIFDFMGKEILRKNIFKNNEVIDVKKIPSGVYSVILTGERSVAVQKVLILR